MHVCKGACMYSWVFREHPIFLFEVNQSLYQLKRKKKENPKTCLCGEVGIIHDISVEAKQKIWGVFLSSRFNTVSGAEAGVVSLTWQELCLTHLTSPLSHLSHCIASQVQIHCFDSLLTVGNTQYFSHCQQCFDESLYFFYIFRCFVGLEFCKFYSLLKECIGCFCMLLNYLLEVSFFQTFFLEPCRQSRCYLLSGWHTCIMKIPN